MPIKLLLFQPPISNWLRRLKNTRIEKPKKRPNTGRGGSFEKEDGRTEETEREDDGDGGLAGYFLLPCFSCSFSGLFSLRPFLLFAFLPLLPLSCYLYLSLNSSLVLFLCFFFFVFRPLCLSFFS